VVAVPVGELEEVGNEPAQPDIMNAIRTAQTIWECDGLVRPLFPAAGSLALHGEYLNARLAFLLIPQ
jgi:hypothetical protein